MFYKEKGFYVSLVCGALAIAALGGVCYKMIQPEEVKEEVAEQPTVVPLPTATAEVEEVGGEPEEILPTEEPEPEEPQVVETANQPAKEELHFEKKMVWPVQGDVILKFSPDRVIFFKTLSEYRVNPAMVIAAKEGTEVKSAARGKVDAIYTSEETGRTVMVDLGDGYKVNYGPLMKIQVNEGDYVEAGQVIGKVAKATKYYSLEGDNLNFSLYKEEKAVDPTKFLSK